MRLEIRIDSIPHQIDSTDPELLGKWVVEIFGRAVAAGINASTQIYMAVYPSWVPDGAGGRPDWIADSRIIGNLYQISTPHDLVAVLAGQLGEAEAMASASGND